LAIGCFAPHHWIPPRCSLPARMSVWGRLAEDLIRRYITGRRRKGRIAMPRNKSFPERQGFNEDAPNNTVAADERERETPATRHLAPAEQRAFHAALRRSVKVVSRSGSRPKQS
jgi:hypothetical protein